LVYDCVLGCGLSDHVLYMHYICYMTATMNPYHRDLSWPTDLASLLQLLDTACCHHLEFYRHERRLYKLFCSFRNHSLSGLNQHGNICSLFRTLLSRLETTEDVLEACSLKVIYIVYTHLIPMWPLTTIIIHQAWDENHLTQDKLVEKVGPSWYLVCFHDSTLTLNRSLAW
jgi:hypothetical protein